MGWLFIKVDVRVSSTDNLYHLTFIMLQFGPMEHINYYHVVIYEKERGHKDLLSGFNENTKVLLYFLLKSEGLKNPTLLFDIFLNSEILINTKKLDSFDFGSLFYCGRELLNVIPGVFGQKI